MLAVLVYNRPTPLNLKFLSSSDDDDDDDDDGEDEADSTLSTVSRSLLVGSDEE